MINVETMQTDEEIIRKVSMEVTNSYYIDSFYIDS